MAKTAERVQSCPQSLKMPRLVPMIAASRRKNDHAARLPSWTVVFKRTAAVKARQAKMAEYMGPAKKNHLSKVDDRSLNQRAV